ncbi:site-specific integrase [Tropicibacter oceani]|uniref:Site-specific integrase n=1 Tax=Tropicibacter oceani TaxID=3058420 RepID=A0ABY8QI34_9RHOB|nr:site-specific integrase [Tropicibacter oceani]WGW03651.1 site-specific integrase [Tropicibacter oceani]
MTRKVNEKNERIKRAYLHYLREAKRMDETTCRRAAEGILKFEKSTGYKCFKKFHIDQPRRFKNDLSEEVSPTTGKPLGKATVSGILRANKAFFQWLAGQPGYKSRISYSDAEYFNQNAKDARAAHAQRETPYPSLEQCRAAFVAMPQSTEIERRNRALFACLMITGARDGALSSFRLKHVDLISGSIFQDGREVRTKGSKTFNTYFLPVDPIYRPAFEEWVTYLRTEKLFGPDDTLFPPPRMGVGNDGFQVLGLKRECYAGAGPLREAIKKAFTDAHMPAFGPHSFRKTLVRWADNHYPTREAFKAFSQNIGHDSVVTTVSAYCHVTQERQAELIRETTP